MRRITELDSLRGLAALAVVLYHVCLGQFAILGTGVDLFFVLSGYLITTIILAKRDEPHFLSTFFVRRSLRIWPIYYLSLLAVIALAAILPLRFLPDEIPFYLTYTQNLPLYRLGVEPVPHRYFSHTWTLAIEEQFYLFWPVLIWTLGRRSIRPVAVGLVLLAVSARMIGYSRWIFLTRCDGLAVGSLLAIAFEGSAAGRFPAGSTARRLALLGAASVGFGVAGPAALRAIGSAWEPAGRPLVGLSLRMLSINIFYGCLIGMIVGLAGCRGLAPLRSRGLAYLGQISYGIYLYHQLVSYLLDDFGGRIGISGPVPLAVAKLGASFALAALSWRYLERPILALKDRFGYREGAIRSPRFAGAGRLEAAETGAR